MGGSHIQADVGGAEQTVPDDLSTKSDKFLFWQTNCCVIFDAVIIIVVVVLVDVVILSIFALITIIISKFPLAKIPLPGESVSDHVIGKFPSSSMMIHHNIVTT